MSIVTERRVLRYFYKGKGYGTKLRAFKAVAKDALMTEVFGPLQDVTVVTAASPFTGEGSSNTYQTRPGFQEMDAAIGAWLDEQQFSANPVEQDAKRSTPSTSTNRSRLWAANP